MIDLPEALLIKRIRANFKHGTLLRTEILLSGKPIIKRLIILNSNTDDNEVHFVLTTSQIKWYQTHSNVPIIFEHFIFVPKGTTKDNPDRDIVVDLRTIYSKPFYWLVKNFRNRKLQFLHSMPIEIMKDIDRKIDRSELIPPGIKAKIR